MRGVLWTLSVVGMAASVGAVWASWLELRRRRQGLTRVDLLRRLVG